MPRKKPYSGKQKKVQLQQHKQKQREEQQRRDEQLKREYEQRSAPQPEESPDKEKEEFASRRVISARGRLVTMLQLETNEEIARRKRDATRPLNLQNRELRGEAVNETKIDIPKRPAWDASQTPEEIEQAEAVYFEEWISGVLKQFNKTRINYFECNLEVWRQLWRVCERADILVITTDARFPLFHFPLSLYDYVVKDLGKPIILVLNKTDLVPAEVLQAWMDYFHTYYPHVTCVPFQSFDAGPETGFDPLKKHKKWTGRRRYEKAQGYDRLVEAIREIAAKHGIIARIYTPDGTTTGVLHSNTSQVPTNAEQAPAETKPAQNNAESAEEDQSPATSSPPPTSSASELESNSDSDTEEEAPEEVARASQKPRIAVGMVGHPNTGKSSLINGLKKKKVVSVSRTPGHTKHWQTIFLGDDVVLIDSPGLVFPALDRPKPLQILCGLFPIAQVREPFSAIRYLAERIPIEKTYHLETETEYLDEPWSPYTICAAYGDKRGYLLARTAAPDVHRAGLEILHDVVDGKIAIYWPPPGFVPTTTDTTPDDEEELETPALNQSEIERRREAKRKKKRANRTNAAKSNPGIGIDESRVPAVLAEGSSDEEGVDEWTQKLRAKQRLANKGKKHQ